VEAVVSVVIAAAATVAAMGNAEHPLDRADGTADTGTDCATNHAAHRAGDTIAFIRSFLGAPNDALGMARLWDAGQRGQDGGASEEQTER
jgi:hypothetical protein